MTDTAGGGNAADRPEPPFHTRATQPVGHFLPANCPRELAGRVILAESLWRAGMLKVTEIATRVRLTSTPLIYEWARLYHWPPRKDVVDVAHNAIDIEMLRRQATRAALAKGQPPPVPMLPDLPSAAPAQGSEPAAVAASEFTAARAQAPMPERERVSEAIRESAAADASADAITRGFVEAVTNVIEEQQAHTGSLTSWGKKLMDIAIKMQADLEAAAGKDAKKVAAAMPLMIANYRGITATLAQAINLQRTVWTLDRKDAKPAMRQDDSPGSRDEPSVPVNPGTYEDYIRTCESAGINTTPP